MNFKLKRNIKDQNLVHDRSKTETLRKTRPLIDKIVAVYSKRSQREKSYIGVRNNVFICSQSQKHVHFVLVQNIFALDRNIFKSNKFKV